MSDSHKIPFQAQVSYLAEQLGELEAELGSIPEPREEDYRIKLDYEFAKRVYKAEIKRLWDRIHKLVRSWPSAV